jgi:hypothetical protein
MEGPSEINSVVWNEEKKSWDYKIIKVDEYFGFTECQQCRKPMSHNIKQCRKPMSHNIKTDGEFKMVYVKCGCADRK